ncbi:MAG: TonB-dependent receptor, partial [Spirochaetaceae bacterium]|nr:TonB-dependent receptor [Spirochaetaceae bacterium]
MFNYKKNKIRKSVFVLCFIALSCVTLFARDVEITVQDGDLEITLEGATVHSWDGTEVICDMDGKAVLEAPDDVQVVVRVSYPGYQNGRIIILPDESSFTVSLSLGGVMESQELVIEARVPEEKEIEPGRSITISGRELAQTAEIGFIEDVLASIRLLPGVGYGGFLNALPSIRGGSPGDVTASYDGFYVEDPFYWGGHASIFDPKMVESAKLSHGVFSTRYGQSTSALLDISSKKPSPTETELELSVSTSATHVNLSVPFNGKGGILLLGRVSYWDPFFALAKIFIPLARSVSQAPFIRSGAVAANYRFTPNVEWYANGFIGSDGVGAAFEYEADQGRMKTISDMKFLWDNLQGFLTTGVVVNPTNAMVLKTSIGAGFLNSNIEAKMNNTITVRTKDGTEQEPIPVDNNLTQDKINSNYQFRLDYDWDMGKGFLFAAGVQERFNIWNQNMLTHLMQEFIDPAAGFQMKVINIDREMTNRGINSSAYSLLEYHNDDWRFDAELGLRVDHVYFIGENPDKSSFSIQTFPAFNPRLNLDFGLLEDVGIIENLSL